MFRYGKQYVPIGNINEEDMKYSPGKLLQLLGFVDAEPLRKDQRFLILKDPQARPASLPTLHATLHALSPCTRHIARPASLLARWQT